MTNPMLFVLGAAILLAGLGFGIVLAIAVYERGLTRARHFPREAGGYADYVERTLRARPAPGPVPADEAAARAVIDQSLAAGQATMTDPNNNWAAAIERAVERGADVFQEAQPGLSREAARKRAREAIRQVGADKPMGGIPSA